MYRIEVLRPAISELMVRMERLASKGFDVREMYDMVCSANRLHDDSLYHIEQIGRWLVSVTVLEDAL